MNTPNPVPYGRQTIEDDDIEAVTTALRAPWLTTGPTVNQFEDAVAKFTGARRGVAVSSGTAALHATMYALGIGPGDEVIVPSLTFAATANAVVYQGGTPIFADINEETLLIDPKSIAAKISDRTKAVIAVDYAGNPCDYDAIRSLTASRGIRVVSDACHSIGGSYRERSVGTLADLSCFSFHPVKHITTAEGGMVVGDDEELVQRMRLFRNHGITSDHRERERKGTCHYEMVDLGFNYRLSDLQCALGLNQLKKLSGWVDRRNEIADRYQRVFHSRPSLLLQKTQAESRHAHHLYVIRVQRAHTGLSRDQTLQKLRDHGIIANVHYPPVHLHPYYRNKHGTAPGLLPVTEKIYEELISLPMFPAMTNEEVDRVIKVVYDLER